MKKRDRSKSTPSLEEPTAVSNKKRHNSLAATLPRSWKSAKNESAVADKTKSLPTGVDSSTAMNGFSTLQRMKKGKYINSYIHACLTADVILLQKNSQKYSLCQE